MLLGLDALDSQELLALVGDRLCLLLIAHDIELVSGARRSVKTKDGNRGRRTGFFDFLSTFVEHGLHAAVVTAAQHHVSGLEGSVLHENRGEVAASLVQR